MRTLQSALMQISLVFCLFCINSKSVYAYGIITDDAYTLDTKQTPPTSKSKKTFVIGVSNVNHFPQFDFNRDEDKGVSWAILEAFAKRYNYKFEYRPLPPVRLQRALNDESIDFIYPDNPIWTAHRSNKDTNIYSIPIVEAVSSTFVMSQNHDLKPSEVHTVAIPYGYTPLTWLPHIDKYRMTVIPSKDLETAMHLIRTGEAMAADIEYNVAQDIMKNNPFLSNISLNKHLPNKKVAYQLSTIKHILVLEQLSQFYIEQKSVIEMLEDIYGIKKYEDVFTPAIPKPASD
uniref:transporter substrate-binding domain-containing protein n=1 Tax=Ningiella ruwaisensis TaxID=2364274 RepID=UPI00109F095E|nr:transporter substrate-binding domain-containing protein [Ningiella ruwaisensis]